MGTIYHNEKPCPLENSKSLVTLALLCGVDVHSIVARFSTPSRDDYENDYDWNLAAAEAIVGLNNELIRGVRNRGINLVINPLDESALSEQDDEMQSYFRQAVANIKNKLLGRK